MYLHTLRTRVALKTLNLTAIWLAILMVAGVAHAQNTVEDILGAVVRVQAKIDESARTAGTLGPERDGHGVIIDSSGLVLTIGYLILESSSVLVTGSDGVSLPASIVAYDSETGFGLVRTQKPLRARPMRLGDSAQLNEGTGVIVAGFGGRQNTIRATVVDRREFAGYWEYLLPNAIFTQPPFPIFGGAALINHEGQLVGIGSLVVGDAKKNAGVSPGNMFIPINALKPILGGLIDSGRAERPRRPWIGVYTEEVRKRVFVTRLASEGPGATGGVSIGDIIVSVGGKNISSLPDFYRKLWSLGAPGVEVPMTVLRQSGGIEELTLRSRDRYSWYRTGKGN